MSFRTFEKWLFEEKTDIFGFDKELEYERRNPEENRPVKRFNTEQCFSMLAAHDIGTKQAFMKFVNEVHWGSGPGALRVWTGTGLSIILDRMNNDLTGQPTWITKKVFQVDQSGYGGFEEAISQELLDNLSWIDKQSLDSPSREYQELEKLTLALAGKLKRTAKDIFLYEGIRRIDPNQYIIKFGVRGGGIEAQDQQKVMQNHTTVTYSPETGLIRIWNTNIESPSGNTQEWATMPSDCDWHFAPTQSREEIIETLAVNMHWY